MASALLLALEDGEGLWVGIGGLVTVVVSVLVSGAVTLWAFRGKSKRQDERTTVGYLRGIIEDLQTQLRLHATQMGDAQKAIDLLRAASQDCELDKEALWALTRSMYEAAARQNAYARRCGAALKEVGRDIGPPEDLPPVPTRRPRAEVRAAADFAARTAEQGAALLGEMDARHKAQADSQGPTP